jgi:hypothetical protein
MSARQLSNLYQFFRNMSQGQPEYCLLNTFMVTVYEHWAQKSDTPCDVTLSEVAAE